MQSTFNIQEVTLGNIFPIALISSYYYFTIRYSITGNRPHTVYRIAAFLSNCTIFLAGIPLSLGRTFPLHFLLIFLSIAIYYRLLYTNYTPIRLSIEAGLCLIAIVGGISFSLFIIPGNELLQYPLVNLIVLMPLTFSLQMLHAFAQHFRKISISDSQHILIISGTFAAILLTILYFDWQREILYPFNFIQDQHIISTN